MKIRNKNKGFTLIELLVVVAIIALLSSIALIALISARQKSRDAKRLGDMTQMNTALELFWSYNKGYPDGINGVPQNMTPTIIATYPTAPTPPDLVCEGVGHSAFPSIPANTYYYAPSGTPAAINGITVYPSYSYYFCLGNNTGNFSAGERIVTPNGVH